MSRRLLDFLAADRSGAPAQRRRAMKRLRAARQTAYEQPWSHAVLRALELEAAAQLQRQQPGSPNGSARAPAELAPRSRCWRRPAGAKQRGRWRLRGGQRQHPPGPRACAGSQGELDRDGARAMRAGAPGNYGYSVFSISKATCAACATCTSNTCARCRPSSRHPARRVRGPLLRAAARPGGDRQRPRRAGAGA